MANSAFELTKANQGATLLVVDQIAHGLVVGDWVYLNGVNYEKAQANAEATSFVVGVVVVQPNSDNFTLQMDGNATGLTGLASGTVYYLSASVAGGIQNTAPLDPNLVVPVMAANANNSGILLGLGQLGGSGGGGASVGTTHDITGQANTFAGGEIVRFDGVNYVLAQADIDDNSHVAGIIAVTPTPTGTTFTVQQSGYMTGLSGLTPGEFLFLSTTVAGATQNTVPTGGEEVAVAVFIPDTTTGGWVLTNASRRVAPRINHVALADGEASFHVNTNVNGFGGVNSLTISYVATSVGVGDFEVANNIVLDVSGSTGGVATAHLINTIEGGANVVGMSCGPGVDPLLQNAGEYVDMTSALNNGVDALTEFTTPGDNVSMFVANGNTVTVGFTTEFPSIAFDLATNAGGAGVKTSFEYSTGVGTWASFNPNDDTDGFRQSGVISWDIDGLTGWSPGTGGDFLVRMTRNQNNINTDPIENFVQVSELEFYGWLKTGEVSFKRMLVDNMDNDLAGQLAVFDSAGLAVPLGQGAATEVLTSNGPNANPSFKAGAGDAVTYFVTQANSFAVGDVIMLSGTLYILAQADSAVNAEVVGVVSAATGADFTVQQAGHMTGLVGLVAGEVYFLDPSVAGAYTSTEPTGALEVSRPVLLADTTTTAFVLPYRGNDVEGGVITTPYDVALNAGFDAVMVPVDLAVQTYAKLNMARSGKFTGEAGKIETAGVGSNVVVDILKNGVSIYTVLPFYPNSLNSLTAGTLKSDGSEEFVSGDVISFVVTQIGSGTAGGGITLTAKAEV